MRGFEFSYDANYHILIFDNLVYLHPVGWFGLIDPRVDALKAGISEVTSRILVYGLEPELALQLNELGFIKLI